MEHDDYTHMLKKVGFVNVDDSPCDKSLFSLDRGPTALEEMTPQSLRVSSLTGSTASSSLTLQLTLKISSTINSPTMHAANYSAHQN
jgi:hypothetical protein